MASRLEELSLILADIHVYPVEPVNPDTVNVDMRYYPRESYDFDRVSLFMESMQQGSTFPPIILAEDRATLIDGAHRTFAYRQLGRKEVPARILPVLSPLDIKALSIMTNSPSGWMPLKKGDVRRILHLIIDELDKQYGTPREGIRQFASSMEEMARWFHVPVTAVQSIAERILALKGGGVPQRPAQTRQEYKSAPQEEGPWGKQEPGALPEPVVRSVLSAPTEIASVPQQSPWDYLMQAAVRTVRAHADLVGDQPAEEAAKSLSAAFTKLPQGEQDFLLRNRVRLEGLSKAIAYLDEED